MHTTRPRTVTAEQERARRLRTRHPGWEPDRLREARQALGWSRPTLARKIRAISSSDVAFTPPIANEQTIMRHERGWAYPSEDWQAAYTHTMDLSRVDLGFCIRETHGATVVTRPVLLSGTPSSDDEWIRQLWGSHGLSGAWEKVTTIDIDRREFTALSGLALVGAAHEWLMADPARIAAALAGRRADAAVIADLTTTMDALRRLDDKLGGKAVNGMVAEQLRLVVRVLRSASYTQPEGQALHGIAAELARMAGWTSYDAGQHSTAQRYYLVGLRAAHEADNPGIAANILRCMAHQARTTGDPATSVTLLRSARTGANGRLTATEDAVIFAGLARSYGRLGDEYAARKSVDDAYHAIEQRKPDEDPDYIYWASTSTIASAAGEALLHIGDAQSAIPHLRESVEQMKAGLPRDLSSYRAILALAYARSGDTDEAITLGHEAVEGAAQAQSGIVGARVAELCHEVSATGHPGADGLSDHLHSVIDSAAV